MKTSHQLARELLALPDLPCFHFDPSRAGCDDERDTSTSEPRVEVVDVDEPELPDVNEDGQKILKKFITVNGDQGDDGEAMSDTEAEARRLLREVYKNTNLRHHPELTMLAEVVRTFLGVDVMGP